ncbi:septum formation family protein [Protaetiibacter larvae]|uniref:Septum formation-related domain-containing protein n=1 Tax=Protaetiibacter larvae TaxID=2592654 RepID=A0A5C1Y5P7_9MICO|nr:septum formation family protein [Protaetiibacter larvae]QEO09116.1 hypothetical protein FLP23_03245 [Protaetiibacter larvae]
MNDRPGDDDTPSVPPTVPPASGGGFAWGLTPRAAEPQPPATTPEPEPLEPLEPLVPAWTPAVSNPPVPPASPVPPLNPVPPASPVPPPLIEPAPTVAWTPPPLEPPRPPEVAPDAVDAPGWDQPTQLIDEVPEAPAVPAPADPVADLAATELLLGAGTTAHDAGTTSALDALFGEQNFRDYDAEPVTRVAPAPAGERRAATVDVSERPGISRAQRVLLSVVGGLVALLALAALFLLGTRLPGLIGPAPVVTPSASPSPSPSPSPTTEPVGPVEPGTWRWNELRGGECLDPFEDPWAEEFTVVDCANPHPAQLVYRGTFPPSAEGVTDDAFPGVEALQGQLSLLCTAPGVVDLAAAAQYPDVQFQGSYPATQEQWDAGERHFYCFVSRGSGEPLTGSIAVPPPAPAAPAA